MAADGPPSNISNLGADKIKANNKNQELNSTSNNGSVITEHTSQFVSFSADDAEDSSKICGYYPIETDSEPKEKISESKHRTPSEVQPSKENRIKRGAGIKSPVEKIINKMADKIPQTNPRNSIMNFDNSPIFAEDITAESLTRKNCLPLGSFSGEFPKSTNNERPHPSTNNKRNSTDDESKHIENALEPQNYGEIKKSNLSFIRNYDPDFVFKNDSTLSIEKLNNDFCNKCDQLIKDYEADIEKEKKKKLQMDAEISQNNSAFEEYEKTYLELEEALKKTDLELYIDSDILFDSYQDLRKNVRDYLESQNCPGQEHLDSMIQTLLDHVICSHPFPPLAVIEELFTSSKHTSWIAHARDQIISLLLKQNNPQVDTPLLIEMFEQKHQLSLTSNESLEKAIECAHRLSKYAIAPETYFKGGLSLEGLSSVNKNSVVMTEEPEPVEVSHKIIESNPPLLPPRPLEFKLLKQMPPPTLGQKEKQLPIINERPSAPPPPTHAEYIPYIPAPNPPSNPSRRPSDYTLGPLPEESLLSKWKEYLDNPNGSFLYLIVTEHRKFENSPRFKGCHRDHLCTTCKAVRGHTKKCALKKCKMCKLHFSKEAEKKKRI